MEADDHAFHVRGVTYGTFLETANGLPFPVPEQVAVDFAQMRETGLNSVRTYTCPPRWFLELAQEHALRVLVGVAWEQHVAFLDDREIERRIRARVRADVESCADHPAVLGYALGNEIPASIVRWHGARRTERFLHRLYRIAKEADPEALVTYVNYPTTEYLQLPFLDFVSFNIFLEHEASFRAYLGRLQNLAGERPLVIAEMGFDSRHGGLEEQAETVAWQIRQTFAAGCAGGFVFAWTDEWARTGTPVEDWDFGLVDRDRRRKPALAAASTAFAETPGRGDQDLPEVSVVVCTYNGAATLAECLEGLQRLDYPSYEVLVVDDGSTDESHDIAARFGVKTIKTENRGLSHARNIGLQAARGELVAYIDDDAHPAADWLLRVAKVFIRTPHAGVGGPNIPPRNERMVARCIAAAPGGPTHVLLSDEEAEHIPGCNMSFRREALLAVGGFDERFRIAGDDVDICWRLQASGLTLGFTPGAVVWHRRRSSIRGYVRQQYEYGKAEAQLERKWPYKYNRVGHLSWAGRIYTVPAVGRRRSQRIHYGQWGTGLFQSLYAGSPKSFAGLMQAPEWYLVLAALAALTLLGLVWTPLLAVAPLLGAGTLTVVVAAGRSARSARLRDPTRGRVEELSMRLLIVFLHLVQPAARLAGRLRHGLAPWRRKGRRSLTLPLARRRALWSPEWRSATARLSALEDALCSRGHLIFRGGDYDRWDIHVRGGLLGAARVRLGLEEHGHGQQLVRFRVWPRPSRVAVLLVAILMIPALLAAGDSNIVAIILGALAVGVGLTAFVDCALAEGAILGELKATPKTSRAGAGNILNAEEVAAGAPGDRRVHGA